MVDLAQTHALLALAGVAALAWAYHRWALLAGEAAAQRQALEALAVELDKVYEGSHNLLCVLDRQGRFRKVNRALARCAGIPESQLEGRPATELIGCLSTSPDATGCQADADCRACFLRNALRDTLATGQSHKNVRVKPRRFCGTPCDDRTYLANVSRLDRDGEACLLLSLQDISSVERAEAALVQTGTLSASLIDLAPIMITLTRLTDEMVVKANDSFLAVTGYAREEVLFRSPPEAGWMPAEQWESITSQMRTHGRMPEMELTLKAKDNSNVECLFRAETVPMDGIPHLLSIAMNTTDRKETLLALRDTLSDSRQREWEISTLVRSARILLETPDFNQAARRLLEECADLIGVAESCVCLTFLEKERNDVSLVYSAYGDMGSQAEVSEPLQLAKVLAIQTGKPVCRNRLTSSSRPGSSGEASRLPIQNVLFCPLPANRHARGGVGVAGKSTDFDHRDIRMVSAFAELTAIALVNNHNLELLKTSEEQLRHAQKIEAIGQLAGGVAHDFNNIIGATMMQLGLLQRNPGIDEETRNSLRDLEAETKRAANLTRQLLLFSRRSVMDPRNVNLNEVVEGLLKMLRRLLGEHIDLGFVPSSVPATINGDAGMLEQVVMNLSVNARDAMPRGGRLEIQTGILEIRAARSESPQDHDGTYVCLSVTDSGCGMTDATLDRIFEPFFTTKEPGKGTGLGLATVYGIVRQHHGWVKVESTVGKGTRFEVFLPYVPALHPAPDSSDAAQPAHHGTGTILLVEDEENVRQLTAQCLRSFGYHVLEASTGKRALKMWEKYRDEVDLLLSDLVLPEGLGGLELSEELRRTKPDLKIIITSGYATELTGSEPRLSEGIVYLPKPYESNALGAALRAALHPLEEALS